MTVTVFGYLISIRIEFLRFYFSVFSLVLVLTKKIYQTLKTVFNHDHISKLLEVCQKKYSVRVARRIFNSLFSVWKCGQTFVSDVSH